MSAAKTEWGLYNEQKEAVPEVLNAYKNAAAFGAGV